MSARVLYLLVLDTENTDSGIKQLAQRYATWVGKESGLPHTIFYHDEPLLEMAAEKAAKAMGGTTALVQRLKPCRQQFIEAIHLTPSHCQHQILIVASPHFPTYLDYLLSDGNKRHMAGTSQLLCLNLDCTWDQIHPGCANVGVEIYEDQLPTAFPYPDLQGRELRPRPAYYYRQSAVIPFRPLASGNSIEVLLVTSSKKRHWLVPKGIHEPGLSAQESARKEAFEEAGVKGRVLQQKLGEYLHEKWGGFCTVEVYPLQVEKVLNEPDWIESHRDRVWCSIEEAKSLLTIPKLIEMLDRLPSSVLVQTKSDTSS